VWVRVRMRGDSEGKEKTLTLTLFIYHSNSLLDIVNYVHCAFSKKK
jgi:hypothetical protein